MSHPDYKNVGEPEDRLIEECGELLQAIGKVKRFGWLNFHPNHPETNNAGDVLSEMNDVEDAIKEMRKKIMRDLEP